MCYCEIKSKAGSQLWRHGLWLDFSRSLRYPDHGIDDRTVVLEIYRGKMPDVTLGCV